MDEWLALSFGGHSLLGHGNIRAVLLVIMLGLVAPESDIDHMPEGVLILDDKVYISSPVRQQELLNDTRTDCLRTLFDQATYPLPPENESTCFRTWDDITCWMDARPGEVVTKPCPVYIDKFYIHGNVTRTCSENGTWMTHAETGRGWSNYSQCEYTRGQQRLSPLFNQHVPIITLLYNIGYGISLTSLLVAVFIMLYFKKLYCPRNILHLNLFLSFIMRSLMSFVRENMFVHNLGLAQDLRPDGTFMDIHATHYSHWQCKTVIFVFQYMLSANYIWILMEGVYLHNLLFVAVFSENSSIRWYIVFGWLSPFSFLIPWAIVKANLDNVYCWNTIHDGYGWIIKGPLLAVILVNFVFFVNILRVLFTKLRASNTREGRRYRYKKLAKSTLVLIPLFGVHYLLMFYLQKDIGDMAEIVKLYFEMICNSFQGFAVALLYCFLNGEVQGEMRKKWHRFQLERDPTPRRNLSTSKTLTSNGQSVVEGTFTSTCSPGGKPGNGNGTAEDGAAKDGVWLKERGRLLLEGNDDCFVSESGFTEIMSEDGK